MVYKMKNFRVNLISRTSLLTVSIFVFTYSLIINVLSLWTILLLSAVLYQVYLLIKYIDKSNRELAYFLESITYSDFSQKFDFSKLGSSFKALSDEFNKILDKFRQARSDREESINYLETVVQHIGVGLISFDPDGNVVLINKSAKRILRITNLHNINALDKISPNFSGFIGQLPSGKKAAYKIIDKDEIVQLLIYTTDFRMQNKICKLVALQNIQSELEEKEIDAWQKLIRVLTHEIMNSVTPISSLASTVNQYLFDKEGLANSLSNENIEDIRLAINAIQKRSEGLVNFVDKYRSLTKIPKPNLDAVKVSQLFERIKKLMESALKGSSIKFEILINPPNLEVTADSDLFEQVLINLLNNAIQSLSNSKEGKIYLTAIIDERGYAVFKVIDNGVGIAADIIDRIFIPFFTTKKEGSGIGLSISQQIIRAHGGSMNVSSRPNEETVFTIRI
jgi:nitrogen fixation/metabolism regulation signal transduction histidine kinase